MALTSLGARSINAAKQAKYSPQELTAGMRNARWAKLCNTVDPAHALTEAERNRRADALMRSQMLALVDAREKKRKAAKAQKIDQAHYNQARETLPHGCALCGPIPKGGIDTMCAVHLAEMKQRLSR